MTGKVQNAMELCILNWSEAAKHLKKCNICLSGFYTDTAVSLSFDRKTTHLDCGESVTDYYKDKDS